jgi:nitrogen fixation NifU-like protein
MYEMYRENILDHGMNLRNAGVLDPASVDYEVHNATCGDHLRLTLQVDDNEVIKAVGWEGAGCAISQAAASMLGEEIIGMTIDQVREIDKEVIYEMLGIPISAQRSKCALLGLKALQVGLYGLDYWRQIEDEDDE